MPLAVHLVGENTLPENSLSTDPKTVFTMKELKLFLSGDIRKGLLPFLQANNQIIEQESLIYGHFDKIKMHSQDLLQGGR